jgi:hypothetical protein
MINKCPKCKSNLNDYSKRSIKIRDINLLGLLLLFGKVSFKKTKKASCDLCGARMR